MSEEASSSNDEITRCQCHLSDMEDDDTLSTSQPSYDEGERKLTSLLKKLTKRGRDNKNIRFKYSSNVFMVSFFSFVFCATFYFP